MRWTELTPFDVNVGLVYQLLCESGSLSRIELAERAQLAPASLTKISRQLISLKMIQEVSHQKSNGGRRAINLAATLQSQALIVQLHANSLELKLCTLDGQCLAQQTHMACPTAEELVAKLIAQCLQFIQQHSANPIAISVLSHARINHEQGELLEYAEQSLATPLPLVRSLQNAFGIFCTLHHTTYAQALTECFWGKVPEKQQILLIGSGKYITAWAMQAKDRLNPPPSTMAELGHIQVDPLGQRCHCGNFGCLDTVAGEAAMIVKVERFFDAGFASNLPRSALHLTAICDAAQQGDELCRRVLQEVAEALGKALAPAVNLLAPQQLIFTGPLARVLPYLSTPLMATLQRQSIARHHQQLTLTASSFDANNPYIGLAPIQQALFNGQLVKWLQAHR